MRFMKYRETRVHYTHFHAPLRLVIHSNSEGLNSRFQVFLPPIAIIGLAILVALPRSSMPRIRELIPSRDDYEIMLERAVIKTAAAILQCKNRILKVRWFPRHSQNLQVAGIARCTVIRILTEYRVKCLFNRQPLLLVRLLTA